MHCLSCHFERADLGTRTCTTRRAIFRRPIRAPGMYYFSCHFLEGRSGNRVGTSCRVIFRRAFPRTGHVLLVVPILRGKSVRRHVLLVAQVLEVDPRDDMYFLSRKFWKVDVWLHSFMRVMFSLTGCCGGKV
jgi:hypothetical protein